MTKINYVTIKCDRVTVKPCYKGRALRLMPKMLNLPHKKLIITNGKAIFQTPTFVRVCMGFIQNMRDLLLTSLDLGEYIYLD